MNRQSTRVLIVEDSAVQRDSAHTVLEARGFTVSSAGTVAEARSIARELAGKLSIVVLDMRLDDPVAPGVTGAELARELDVAPAGDRRGPDFLFRTAYGDADFFQAAVRHGAAAYLVKSETDLMDLIRHVRVLALRRALDLDDPDLRARLPEIGVLASTGDEARAELARAYLAPLLYEFLGTPLAFLVSQGGRTRPVAIGADLPDADAEAWRTLQNVSQMEGPSEAPFVLDPDRQRRLSAVLPGPLIDTFAGAAFTSLFSSSDLRLDVAFLGRERTAEPLAESPAPLARLARQFVRPHLVSRLVWATEEIWRKAEDRRRQQVRGAANLCLALAADQRARLEELVAANPELRASRAALELGGLVSELEASGERLDSLGALRSAAQPVQAGAVARGARERVRAREGAVIEVVGACEVLADEGDLRSALAHLLQFLAARPGADPWHLRVACEEVAPWGRILVEDDSRRLPGPLRASLFEPYAQPLDPLSGDETVPRRIGMFLVKALVEANRGLLDDRTDEMSGEVGHRFEIRLRLGGGATGRSASSSGCA